VALEVPILKERLGVSAKETVLTFPAKSYNYQIARIPELESIPNNPVLLRIAHELARFSAC